MTSVYSNATNAKGGIFKATADANETQEDADDLYEWLQDDDNINGCTVLFSKKYDEVTTQFKLLRSDFCVIVATNKRKLLRERGLRSLCVDKIPWYRSDELSITVLFVVDNCGVEHTVAFMFSDRNDGYIYEVFFTKLKKYLEDAQPEMLLTPVSQGIPIAFKNATKIEITKSVFSPWQLDETWRNHLKVIKQTGKRKEVYKTLRGLQMESDRAEFEELYSKFLSDIKSNSLTKEFYKTWMKNFHRNLKSWANCFRAHHVSDTDIHNIQALYESLKYNISKTDKDILECTENLVKALQNKHSNKTLELDKNRLFKKEVAIKRMHMLSKGEEYQFEEKSDCWLLECDKTDKIHEIRMLQPSACCEIKCSECGICYHTYTCTCFDYLVKNLICKHVHYIHGFCQNPEDTRKDNNTKEQSSQSAEKLKKELISMSADIVERLNEVSDEDVLCTLRSQLQNSLMLLTYFSAENGSGAILENNEDLRNGSRGIKRKSFEEIDENIKKSLKG